MKPDLLDSMISISVLVSRGPAPPPPRTAIFMTLLRGQSHEIHLRYCNRDDSVLELVTDSN